MAATQHRNNTGSTITALRRIPANATTADINRALDDADTDAAVTELLYRLGAGDIYHPAAA